MFLLGHWDNYEELEEKLSMPELLKTAKAAQEREYRQQRFLAAINGVSLDDEDSAEAAIERARRKAMGDDPEINDIVNLKGAMAQKEGFGVGFGIGYEAEGGA